MSEHLPVMKTCPGCAGKFTVAYGSRFQKHCSRSCGARRRRRSKSAHELPKQDEPKKKPRRAFGPKPMPLEEMLEAAGKSNVVTTGCMHCDWTYVGKAAHGVEASQRHRAEAHPDLPMVSPRTKRRRGFKKPKADGTLAARVRYAIGNRINDEEAA